MDLCICMAQSFRSLLETITTFLANRSYQHKMKSFLKSEIFCCNASYNTQKFIYICTHSAFFPLHESLSQNHSLHLCLSICLLVHHSFIQYLSVTCWVPDTVPSSGNNTYPSISASLSGLPPICHPLSVTDVPSLSCWFVIIQLIKMPQSFSSSAFFCHLTFPLLHQASKELPAVSEVPSFLQNLHRVGPTLLALALPESLHCTL